MIEKNTYNRLNVLGISDLVIFKGNEMTIKIKKDVGHNLEQRLAEDEMTALGITVKEGKISESYNMDDFYRSGVLLEVKHIQYENDFYVLKVKAIEKIRVERFIEVEGELMADYYISPDAVDLEGPALKALLDHIKGLVKEISVFFKGSEPFVKYIEDINDVELLAGVLLQYLQISIDEKYTIFEIPTSSDKGLKLIDVLKKQIEAFTFQKEMADKFSTEANKNYRKAFLREQLKAIQEELNEGKPEHGKKDYHALIEESTMPEDVKQTALDEVAKMEGLSPQSAERNVVINYLDLLVSLPWGKFKAPEIDIENARELLEKEHYGLKEVKDRIIQHLAVMKLKKEKQGSILLLVGPPGTGKTSLGKSIAEALGRPYVRMSLGGVRDEAEIRGHRRTYVAALPGRVIQGMKKAKQTNPVFVLDEIDKLQIGNSGDPASALLEVLDPEQNNSFQDHYLEVPYDLSDVFFIATANSLRGIPGPLRDRMEVIEVSSYTNHEKFHIAKRHLVPEVLEDHGLSKSQLEISDEALTKVIDVYTREAGVRNLKRQIASIARAASEKVVLHTVPLPYMIKEETVEDLLGHPVARHDVVGKENAPGVVTGLAWTPVGGEILFIEGSFMPGGGQLILTGKLGDVMKESARISLSLVKSRLAFQTANFEFGKKDLHVHVPSGATPKDGPSAGVALFTAIASLILGRQVPSDFAMTGEVTLRGTIMPVGGIKEKIIAAHRAGVKRVIIPEENEQDLKDVPDEVRDALTFYPVNNIEAVLKLIFDIALPEGNFIDQSLWSGSPEGSIQTNKG
jgi:ATP-dependent Lon protease